MSNSASPATSIGGTLLFWSRHLIDIAEIEIAVGQIESDAETTGESYLNVWLQTAGGEIGDAEDGLLLRRLIDR